MGNCAGRASFGVVRGCPLGTSQDCCEWHASGMAGDEDRGSGLGRRYELRQWARPVQGATSLVGKRPVGRGSVFFGPRHRARPSSWLAADTASSRASSAQRLKLSSSSRTTPASTTGRRPARRRAARPPTTEGTPHRPPRPAPPTPRPHPGAPFAVSRGVVERQGRRGNDDRRSGGTPEASLAHLLVSQS
jgi:hypothetical protein